MSFRRPGKIEVLIAAVVADVAIHPKIRVSSGRIGIDRAWIGNILLIVAEVLRSDDVR